MITPLNTHALVSRPFSYKGFLDDITVAKAKIISKKFPIDPLLISKQAELIQLKRTFRCLAINGTNFPEEHKTQNIVKTIRVNSEVKGFIKQEKTPKLLNNAILEKIRWDIAVLMGDGDIFVATDICRLPDGQMGHIQPFQKGKVLGHMLLKKESVPEEALLRTLVASIVYGGFDDHLLNFIFDPDTQKIYFFDNCSSLTTSNKYINWVELFRPSIRPSVLMFPSSSSKMDVFDIDSIISDLERYKRGLIEVRKYFLRPDIQKLLSHLSQGWFDERRSVSAMEERILQLETGLANPDISPLEWVYKSFPYYRIATAIHMAADTKISLINVINKVGFTSIFVKAKEIAAQGYSPLDVLKIAEENESIIEIKRKVLALSKSNAETCLEGLNKVKEHLYANSELEYKDSKLGIEDFSHLMSLRLTHKGIPFSKNNDHTFNISGLRGVPLSHNRLLLQYKNIELPPISINELALLLKGQTVERIAKAESFINELTAHQVSVHVCSLFEKRATTLALARGDFAVIQIRNETNTRFMIAHKDIKGKITSRDIGQNIGAVLEARRFKALSPQPVIFPPLISEINVKGVIYPVRPGEMVGTYVVQIGNFDVAPMYLKDLLEWANGPRLGSLEHI